MQMNRKRAHPLPHEIAEAQATMRPCDHPGCKAEGACPAPKSREALRDFFWFCTDHARAYNESWNYFADLSGAQIEAQIRRDTCWDRPTRPLGDWRIHDWKLRDAVFTHFNLGAHGWEARKDEVRVRAQSPEEKALSVLGLDHPADFVQIRARYRELVKKHHPDANGGCKQSEEKLKDITQAYQVLKAAHQNWAAAGA